jgi:hypothetical protein
MKTLADAWKNVDEADFITKNTNNCPAKHLRAIPGKIYPLSHNPDVHPMGWNKRGFPGLYIGYDARKGVHVFLAFDGRKDFQRYTAQQLILLRESDGEDDPRYPVAFPVNLDEKGITRPEEMNLAFEMLKRADLI